MIFECTYFTFDGVAVVRVGREKLEVDVVFAEGFLYCVVALVVEDVDSGSCTMLI